MNKFKIIVPKYVEYIGRDWCNEENAYRLEEYNFPHILNKVLTGCGYTEYCLRNSQDLVLISPRKFLLENKMDQHEDDLNIYYAENKTEIITNYERDLSREDKSGISRKLDNEVLREKKRESIEELKRKVIEHVMKCRITYHKPVKILVTYDSFRHVKEALGDQIRNFQVVVDEFQSIFIDARFKSDAELELLHHLQDLQRVCLVSATPMLDRYLDMLPEFKDLPYYEFDWKTENPGRVVKPKLEIKFTSKSLNFEISKIIQSYLTGNFETKVKKDSQGVLYNLRSDEAVFFLNSVKGICKAITTNLLSLNQCNILCAKNDDNNKLVRDAFNEVIKKKAEQAGIKDPVLLDGIVIGHIPKEDELHKMFTFCTRTVYLGADFYSECARTFIFSDSNIECLSVDISMDLEQILGRQRLKENPWKNSALMFIKTTRETRKIPWEVFKARLDEKERKTISLLESYNIVGIENKHDLAEKYQKDAKVSHYKDDYVAVNEHAGKDIIPVFNRLMQVSEIRAFEMQQTDYADRFTVIGSINEKNLIGNVRKEITDLAERFSGITDMVKRWMFIAALENDPELNITEDELRVFFSLIPGYYVDKFNVLGFEGIRACKYQDTYIKRKVEELCGNSQKGDRIKEEIYRLFTVGYRYSKSDIKSTLKNAYERVGYQKTAKASDLEEYFIVKDTKLQDETKKWVNGFELLEKR